MSTFLVLFFFIDGITGPENHPSDSSSWHPPRWPSEQIVLWLWTDGVTLPCLLSLIWSGDDGRKLFR